VPLPARRPDDAAADGGAARRGLLGARLGALSMILYLAMGAAGLPVFTPTVPLLGVARLLGDGRVSARVSGAAWAVGALLPKDGTCGVWRSALLQVSS